MYVMTIQRLRSMCSRVFLVHRGRGRVWKSDNCGAMGEGGEGRGIMERKTVSLTFPLPLFPPYLHGSSPPSSFTSLLSTTPLSKLSLIILHHGVTCNTRRIWNIQIPRVPLPVNVQTIVIFTSIMHCSVVSLGYNIQEHDNEIMMWSHENFFGIIILVFFVRHARCSGFRFKLEPIEVSVFGMHRP